MRSTVLLSCFILAIAVTGAAQDVTPSPVPAASPVPVASPAPAATPSPEAPRSLGPAFDAALLSSLPMSNGVWSIFETIESTAILDRIESSGLYVGEAGLMGVDSIV